jgi:zinc transporter ZupT
MPRGLDLILIIASMLMAIGFTVIVWVFRRPPYPHWAKLASLIGCVAGVSWSVITLFQHPFSIQRYPFVTTVSVKQVLGGIFLGIVISIGISRRYDKHAATNNSDVTPEV